MKVSLLTLGCKVNQAEIISLERELREKGYSIVSLDENPDVCVINTCAVTSKSDYQSRQLIRRAAGSGAKVIATGCYSQMNSGHVERMEGVIEVVGNREKHNIIEKINKISSSNVLTPVRIGKAHRSRCFLKIQDGCNYSCSYCLISKARGAATSIEPEKVVESIKKIESEGYQEVVLTGIHLGLYGVDLSPSMGLSRLIGKILENTAIRRIRLSSLEVNEVDRRLIEILKDDRVCNHLHVPLQSGDEKILKLMKRQYSTADFIEKLEKIASKMPDFGFGTDVITGFPGEGEPEFENTVSVLKRLPFTYMHSFPYSERPGTEAISLPGRVDRGIRKARTSLIRALSDEKKSAFIETLKGKVVDVLLEENVNGEFIGTSGNYIKVAVPFREGMRPGSIINVRVQGQTGGKALGKPELDL